MCASPLHVAAVNGRLDLVKLLVETFLSKLDVRDSNGQTPVELAQDKEEEEIVSYLLDLKKTLVSSIPYHVIVTSQLTMLCDIT